MRILRLLCAALSLLLPACETTRSSVFFGEGLLGDNWSAASFAGYLKNFSEKPIQEQSLKDGQSVFRLLILQASGPVHMIKVTTGADGNAVVSIKRTKTGYNRRGGHAAEQKYRVKPSRAQAQAFLGEMSDYDFWAQEAALQYIFTDELSTHPNMILFEGASAGKHTAFYDYDTVMRKNSADLILAFYKLANLDETDEWSLADYFSEFSKVDWMFKDE